MSTEQSPMDVINLVLVVLVAAFTMLIPLGFAHGGFDIDALPVVGGAAGVLGLLALYCLRAIRRAPAIGALGLVVVALPLSVHLFLAGTLCWRWLFARAAEYSVSTLVLRERPILWPRIAEPVGLTLDVSLEHALPADGILYPPVLVMDGPAIPDTSDYFRGDPPGSLSVSSSSHTDTPAPPSPAHLLYDLYPRTVSLVSPGESICFDKYALGKERQRLINGDQLGAKWRLAREGGGSIDLSESLTRALRDTSVFQGKPDAWWALTERLTPNALEAAGYRPCRVRFKLSYIDGCYCVPS